MYAVLTVDRAREAVAAAIAAAQPDGSVQSGESASGDQPATGTTVPTNSADSGWNPEALAPYAGASAADGADDPGSRENKMQPQPGGLMIKSITELRIEGGERARPSACKHCRQFTDTSHGIP